MYNLLKVTRIFIVLEVIRIHIGAQDNTHNSISNINCYIISIHLKTIIVIYFIVHNGRK